MKRREDINKIRRICHIEKGNDGYILPKVALKLDKLDLLNIFRRNIKINTFLYIILPFIVFGLIGIITLILIIVYFKIIDIRMAVFFIFVSIMFLVFSLIKLVMCLKKMKCYVSKNNRRTFYNMISNKEYLEIISFIEGE